MVLALVSCASPNLPPQEDLAPVEAVSESLVEIVETIPNQAEKPIESSELAEEVVEEPSMPVIAINPELQKQEEMPPVEEFIAEPDLKPISKHYVINKQDIYVSAYIGEATVSYPESWDNAIVEEVIAYLANKYPAETKDITFIRKDNTITFFYPKFWGETEYNYAISLLSQELLEVKEQEQAEAKKQKSKMTLEALWPVRILDKEKEEDPNKTIVYEPVENPVVEEITEVAKVETEIPDYIDAWWEDPIFMAPTIEPETEFSFVTESSTVVIYDETTPAGEDFYEPEQTAEDAQIAEEDSETIEAEKPIPTDTEIAPKEPVLDLSPLKKIVPLAVLLIMAFIAVLLSKRKKK